jgi:hypothetical protein
VIKSRRTRLRALTTSFNVTMSARIALALPKIAILDVLGRAKGHWEGVFCLGRCYQSERDLELYLLAAELRHAQLSPSG